MLKKLHDRLDTALGYFTLILTLPIILGMLLLYWFIDLLDYLLEG